MFTQHLFFLILVLLTAAFLVGANELQTHTPAISLATVGTDPRLGWDASLSGPGEVVGSRVNAPYQHRYSFRFRGNPNHNRSSQLENTSDERSGYEG